MESYIDLPIGMGTYKNEFEMLAKNTKLKRKDPGYMNAYYKKNKDKFEKKETCPICHCEYIKYKKDIHLKTRKHLLCYYELEHKKI